MINVLSLTVVFFSYFLPFFSQQFTIFRRATNCFLLRNFHDIFNLHSNNFAVSLSKLCSSPEHCGLSKPRPSPRPPSWWCNNATKPCESPLNARASTNAPHVLLCFQVVQRKCSSGLMANLFNVCASVKGVSETLKEGNIENISATRDTLTHQQTLGCGRVCERACTCEQREGAAAVKSSTVLGLRGTKGN